MLQKVNYIRPSYLKLFLSILVILSVYSFGNFGFLNLFGIKLEVQIIILTLMVLPLLIIAFDKIKLSLYKEPIILLLLYSIFSFIILEPNNILNILQLSISLLVVVNLYRLNIIYIDFIIKGIIILCTFFSILGIVQFILLQIDFGLINQLDMNFYSASKYIDLSDSSFFSYLGFAVIGDMKNIFGIDFVRLKSFGSEPSVLVSTFYSIGIMSLLYSKKFKFMGVIIFLFTVFIAYPGVVHMSLLFSLLFLLYIFILKPYPKNGSIFILISIFILFLLVSVLGSEFMSSFVSSSKEGSALARFGGIIFLFKDIMSNPFVNLDIPVVPPVGFLINNALVFPLVGIYISLMIFYRLFKNTIEMYQYNKLFTILITGMLIQLSFFSSYGWETLPGYIILSLICIKMNYSLTKIKSDINA